MHIFFYIIDCLRPDFVGAYNPTITNTPNLDEFAQQSLQFCTAHANDTWSKPNAVSLLTGYYADSVGMMQRPRRLVPEVPTLAGELSKVGYTTIGLSANTFVSARFGLDRGFERFELHRSPIEILQAASGKQLNSRAFELLTQKIQPASRPIFCMIWNMDVHSPFYDRNLSDQGIQPEVTTYKELQAEAIAEEAPLLYQEMVTYADCQFGNFIAFLKDAGIYDQSLIFVLSDHGESLGEHNQVAHANLPFVEETNIVLLVKGAKRLHRKLYAITELVDIPKTVYDIVGIQPRWPLPGLSFRNAVLDQDASFRGHRWGYAEGQELTTSNKYASVLTRQWHYLDLLRDEDVNKRPLVALARQLRRYPPRCYSPTMDVRHHDYASLPSAYRSPLCFLIARIRLALRRTQNRRFFNQFVKYTETVNEDSTLKAQLRRLGYLR